MRPQTTRTPLWTRREARHAGLSGTGVVFRFPEAMMAKVEYTNGARPRRRRLSKGTWLLDGLRRTRPRYSHHLNRLTPTLSARDRW